MLINIQCGCSDLGTIEVPDDATDVDIRDEVMEEVENYWISWDKVDEDGYPIED